MPTKKYSTDEERAAARKASALAYYYRHLEKCRAGQKISAAKHKEKRAERGRAYEAENAEKIKERRRLYRLANKEKQAAKYLENRAAIRSQQSAYYSANAEAIKAYVRNWAAENKPLIRIMSSTKRARKRNATGRVSPDIAERLMAHQKCKCICCRGSLKKLGFHLDHITPLSKGGAHEDGNLQLLCPDCNLRKHAKDPVEFMQSRGFLI